MSSGLKLKSIDAVFELDHDVCQGGFVLIWMAILSFVVVFVGVTLLYLAKGHVTKLNAQIVANNLSLAGFPSAEYGLAPSATSPSNTLLAMAMVAHAEGFTSFTPTNDTAQVFGNGDIWVNHNNTSISQAGRYTVQAFVRIKQGIISNLVSALGGINNSAFSETMAGRRYVRLMLDMSGSIQGGSINQQLAWFDVIQDSDHPHIPGPNGMLDANGIVVPRPFIRRYLPAWVEPLTRAMRPWNDNNLAFPYPVTSAAAGCVSHSEHACAGRTHSHEGGFRAWSDDVLVAYKNAATVLLRRNSCACFPS